MRLKRAFESSASLASNAALWLSVWRMMLRKNFVFGFGAPDFILATVNTVRAEKV
jgi:hypothetical protein